MWWIDVLIRIISRKRAKRESWGPYSEEGVVEASQVCERWATIPWIQKCHPSDFNQPYSGNSHLFWCVSAYVIMHPRKTNVVAPSRFRFVYLVAVIIPVMVCAFVWLNHGKVLTASEPPQKSDSSEASPVTKGAPPFANFRLPEKFSLVRSISPTTGRPLPVRNFTVEDWASIARLRDERRDEAMKLIESKAPYSLRCPACGKPNQPSRDACTGCSCKLVQSDAQPLVEDPYAPFFASVQSSPPFRAPPVSPEKFKLTAPGVSRPVASNKYGVVIDDIYGISRDHLLAIPSPSYGVLEDITHLNASHIEMLQGLHKLAVSVLMARYSVKELIIPYMRAGFNVPVSVRRLHMHVVLPPYTHAEIFDNGGPRWNAFDDVIEMLRLDRRVTVNTVATAKSLAYYEEAMKAHLEVVHIYDDGEWM